MMRYSEISRELSTDSVRYSEFGEDEYDRTNQRKESPTRDVSNCSGALVNQSPLALCRREHPKQHQFSHLQHDYDDDDDNLSLGNRSSRSIRSSGFRNSKRFLSGSAGGGRGTGGGSVDSTPNGAATVVYVRQRKDSTKSTQSCQLESENVRCNCASKSLNMKSSRRKHSIGCLNTFSSSPDSPRSYYSAGNGPASGKSHSLPAQTCMKSLDGVILNALRVPADELANQLTLLDFAVFAVIQPDELTSCAWTKKDKHVVTPNIVAFTKRFNHTSFWTVQEILSGDQPKQRAEILTHFIKVAKKLHELNNLHSLFAIISALQSASIYRLKRTWACLAKKDRNSFERLSDIFSDQNNWENLRAYLESLRLPCIPYLGLFLTDLIYIDLAFPHKGGLEPEQRRNRMNNILRVIANYQQSNYTYIQPIETTQKYLTSIRYIEELQNIFEEDQYKKSLKLEPLSPQAASSSSCSSTKESSNVDVVTPTLACLNLSPAKTIGSLRIGSAAATKFIPGHRKCRSLGTNVFGKSNTGYHDAAVAPPTDVHYISAQCQHSLLGQQSRHLLDDSVLEQSYCHMPNDSVKVALTDNADVVSCHRFEGGGDLGMFVDEEHSVQGCVRRKTVQKEGRKPAVASWQRYWLQIWANSLVYFPPKSFKGCDRSDFKREPCKVCPLDGWFAQIIDNAKQKNSFELYNSTLGTIYKFRTDSPQATVLWTNAICNLAAQRTAPRSLPINLMSFE